MARKEQLASVTEYKKALADLDNVDKELQELEAKKGEIEGRAKNLEGTIAKAAGEKNTALDMFVKGDMSEAAYQAVLKKYNAARAAVNENSEMAHAMRAHTKGAGRLLETKRMEAQKKVQEAKVSAYMEISGILRQELNAAIGNKFLRVYVAWVSMGAPTNPADFLNNLTRDEVFHISPDGLQAAQAEIEREYFS